MIKKIGFAMLAVSVAVMFTSNVLAVTVTVNGTTRFDSGGFETETVGADPAAPTVGSYILMQDLDAANVEVVDLTPPGAAEGSNHLMLQNTGNAGSSKHLGAMMVFDTPATAGDVISADLSFLVDSVSYVSGTSWEMDMFFTFSEGTFGFWDEHQTWTGFCRQNQYYTATSNPLGITIDLTGFDSDDMFMLYHDGSTWIQVYDATGTTPMAVSLATQPNAKSIDIGSNRELFVDNYLIDKLDDARLVLHHPRPEGAVLKLDKPWEGRFSGYCTVIKDGDLYRAYYRGMPEHFKNYQIQGPTEVTCVAESTDGKTWTKPELGIYEIHGTKKNNVVYAHDLGVNHNFTPFLDTRPGVPKSERYKATGGLDMKGGANGKLYGLVSPDGLHWKKIQSQPIRQGSRLDSANLAFWSDSEQCYVCYFRHWINDRKIRWVGRATSKDFLSWSSTKPMKSIYQGKPAPTEHIYTNQTLPYFRAPQIYIAAAARFMPGRKVLSDAEAKEIGVDPRYFNDVSDSVLMTSRGGDVYDRTFMEGFIRNEIGPGNWVSRSNYPAWGIVQTGPDEMSFYANCNYAQPTAELRRYSMRLDGFASIQAGYDSGSMLTKPLTFKGDRLTINFATSAAGSVHIEIQDADGHPIPGYTLAEADELIGNEIEKTVTWQGKANVSALAGHPVRLLFVLKDADIFAMKFE